MSNRMTAAEIAECARLADVVDGPLSAAGAEAYRALGSMAKRMARELAVREQERAAWVRLINAAEEGPAALEHALQALRDLGVDVDALLSD